MNKRSTLGVLLLGALLWIDSLAVNELPRLGKGVDPTKQTFQEQKKLPDLPQPYVSAAPEDIGDGLEVGILDAPGAKEAIQALVKNDQAGKFANLDSLLLWKDGN